MRRQSTSKGTGALSRRIGLRIAHVLLMLIVAPMLSAQTVRISGTVLDNNTRQPIGDVNISVENRGGATTDAAGRFVLLIPEAADDQLITFRHVSYDQVQLSIGELRGKPTVLLEPRIIPLQTAEISGRRPEGIAARDIQLSVTNIEARDFEGRGFTDAGDLLQNNHAIQVDEEFSGRKTLSMRGGNPDDVIVLYDGMKINESSDNSFDLSLIDLADIERFELIKGSNTTLYGSDAFSGVINIVPREERPYTIRVQQQIGSWDAGTWGVQLYRRFGRWNGSYSVRNGATKRAFDDVPEDKLLNTFLNHSAYLGFDVPSGEGSAGKLRLNFRSVGAEYVNERDAESLATASSIAGAQYRGTVAGVDNVFVAAGWSRLDRDVRLDAGTHSIARDSDDNTVRARAERLWEFGGSELLLSYQFARSTLALSDVQRNLLEQPLGFEAFTMNRSQHAIAAVGKLHGETGSPFLRSFDFDVAVRHDIARDGLSDVLLREGSADAPLPTSRDWSHSVFKFAVSLSGIQDDILLDMFMSYGNNVRFPTLSQQANVPALLDTGIVGWTLEAETNRSVELGMSVTRSFRGTLISGWEIDAGLFQNNYTNKIRSIGTPGIPVTLYDNVDEASITGLEGTACVYFSGKRVLAEIGLSRYFISDLSAFPFRSETKFTMAVSISHAGYSFRILAFQEGEQIGILRLSNGDFAEASLPSFRNIDIHAGSSFTFGGVGAFFNISLRNILNDSDLLLSGLALRDRRYYVTIGAQY